MLLQAGHFISCDLLKIMLESEVVKGIVDIGLIFINSIVALISEQDDLNKCAGFGYFKDIDESGTINIVSPLSKEDMKSVRIILKSKDFDFSSKFF